MNEEFTDFIETSGLLYYDQKLFLKFIKKS